MSFVESQPHKALERIAPACARYLLPTVPSEKKFSHVGPYAWAVLEFVVGSLAMLAAYKLTPASLATAGDRHLPAMKAAWLYGLLLTLSAHALGLHNNLNLKSRWRMIVLTIGNVTLSMTLISLLISVALYGQIGRIILVLCAGLTIASSTVLRLAIRRQIHESPLRIGVAGDARLRTYLAELASENTQQLRLCDYAPATGACDLVVAQDAHLRAPHETDTLLQIADRGVQIFTVTAFVEAYFYRIPIQYISADWLFSIDFRRLHPFYHHVKRFTDFSLALTGIVLGAPLMLIAALAIRLESAGPVFYSQVRVGLFQRPFRIWKLRTMRVDAEQGGAKWASIGDARVTLVGRVLRKTRIDELPQFWNILRGDMAFVGPRPERPEFVEQLAAQIPYYKQRHLVKPGLTGWAQICYPYGASVQDTWNKLSYDFYYIKNSSLTLDFQILLQTVGAISRGSR